MTTTYAVGQRITATLLQTLADATLNKPVVRLIQQSAQSFADNADTAVTFGAGSEDIDTNAFHDESTNTSRITPSVAGIYDFRALFVVPAATDYLSLQVSLRKNGTVVPSVLREGPNATSSSRSIQVSAILSSNGSTDFFEVYALQDNSTSASRNTPSSGGSFSCTFECEFLRPS